MSTEDSKHCLLFILCVLCKCKLQRSPEAFPSPCLVNPAPFTTAKITIKKKGGGLQKQTQPSRSRLMAADCCGTRPRLRHPAAPRDPPPTPHPYPRGLCSRRSPALPRVPRVHLLRPSDRRRVNTERGREAPGRSSGGQCADSGPGGVRESRPSWRAARGGEKGELCEGLQGICAESFPALPEYLRGGWGGGSSMQ